MSIERNEKYIWPLLFAGLFIGGLGFAVARNHDTLGWVFNLVGVMLMAVGVAMLWMRSRTRSKPEAIERRTKDLA